MWCPLKTTPTGRPDARAFLVKGRESETEQQRSKKKTMKTSKQNKTNSNTVAANKQQNSGTQNRTEQSPAAEMQTQPESGIRNPESLNTQPSTMNVAIKPYVNFAERDFNR